MYFSKMLLKMVKNDHSVSYRFETVSSKHIPRVFIIRLTIDLFDYPTFFGADALFYVDETHEIGDYL